MTVVMHRNQLGDLLKEGEKAKAMATMGSVRVWGKQGKKIFQPDLQVSVVLCNEVESDLAASQGT